MRYNEMFPGRFIAAGEFDGKTPTLTIDETFMEKLEGEKGDAEPIMRFVEMRKGTDKQLEWVLNRTNARCLIAMFGEDSDDWAGKRGTLFPEKDTSGLSDSGYCIRVKGSPDIDGPVTAIMPSTRFRKETKRKMVVTSDGTKPGADEQPHENPDALMANEPILF